MIHQVTKLAIENIHPKWKVLLNTPASTGETLIEILDKTITSIIDLGVKLSPNHPDKILRCLRLDPDLIKVVVLLQDPYPQPDVATGLAAGVRLGEKIQPTLSILMRELGLEYDSELEDFDTTLESWEEQGVLMLNSSLSCEVFKPGTHTKLWEPFVRELIKVLNDFKITRTTMTSIVFVFLGAQAQLYSNLVSEKLHYKILRYHPAAETHGSNKFVGFYKEVNVNLIESGQTEIKWLAQNL